MNISPRIWPYLRAFIYGFFTPLFGGASGLGIANALGVNSGLNPSTTVAVNGAVLKTLLFACLWSGGASVYNRFKPSPQETNP